MVDFSELSTELNASWHHDFPITGTEDLSAGHNCSVDTHNFGISYDGGAVATITLDQNYTLATLITALQTKIDAGIGSSLVTVSSTSSMYITFELIGGHYITLSAGALDFLVVMGITAGTYHATIAEPTFLDGSLIKATKYVDTQVIIDINGDINLGPRATNNTLQMRSRSNLEQLVGETRRIILAKAISGGMWKVNKINNVKKATMLQADLYCEEVKLIASSGWD